MKRNIQDVAEVMIGHTYRNKDRDKRGIEHDPNGDTHLVQSKDINDDGSVNSDNLPLVALGATRSKAYLEKGDVLLSSRGNFKAGVWEGMQSNALATSTVYVIRITDDSIDPYYLALFLNSELGQREIHQYVRGAAIASLPKSNFMNVLVPVPSVESQKLALKVQQTSQMLAKLQMRKLELSKGIAESAIQSLLTQ